MMSKAQPHAKFTLLSPQLRIITVLLVLEQDEEKCEHEVDDQVKAVQASLPKANDQKGFELSYITRCDITAY